MSTVIHRIAPMYLALIVACDQPDDPTAAAGDESTEAGDADEGTYVGVASRDVLDLTAVGDPQGFLFQPIISDGTPPSTCPTNHVVTGFQCFGGYCDDVRIECHGYGGGNMGTSSWSAWFEEGGKNRHECSAGSYVTGVVCQGDNCDNLSVECTTSPLAQTDCQWTPWFSEEDAAFLANVGDAVRGIQCSGTHCDNVKFFVCDTGA